MININKILLPNLLFVAIMFSSCSSSQDVTSVPNEKKIIVDGIHTDWKSLDNIKGENIAFGFSNDSENFYIVMITNDRNKIWKIIMGGLDVWLEEEDTGKKIGIRYPERSDAQGSFNPIKPPQQNEEMNPTQITQKELYILNDDEKVIKSFFIDGDMYRVKINVDNSGLCYEVKIPIEKSTNPEFVNITPGKTVSVTFKSGEIKIDQERPKMEDEGGMPPTPPNGTRGPGGPGGPGGSDRNNINRPDSSPLDYSFKVLIPK